MFPRLRSDLCGNTIPYGPTRGWRSGIDRGRKRRTLIETYGKYGLILSAFGLYELFYSAILFRSEGPPNTPVSNFLSYEFSLVICLGLSFGLSDGGLESCSLSLFSISGNQLLPLPHSSDHADGLLEILRLPQLYLGCAAGLIACAYAALSWNTLSTHHCHQDIGPSLFGVHCLPSATTVGVS